VIAGRVAAVSRGGGIDKVKSAAASEVRMTGFHWSGSGMFHRVFLVISVTIVLAGCGKNGEGQGSASNGQIVARVGDQEITTQELDTEFRWANVPNDKRQNPEIVKRILGELVTRKYLLQQALVAKLDREPGVLLDILRSREQVLANAFANREVATKIAALTKVDIVKFIANHPSKFSDQQIFHVDQISFARGPNDQSIVEATKDLNSLEQVDQKLTGLGVPHTRSSGTLNSAELPDELLKSVQAKKQDSVFFARSGQNDVFFQVNSEEPHPVDGAAAMALAQQLMRLDLMKTEASIVAMSANAEAKYEGDYAKIMAAQPVGSATN
jgi:EpsD family peptidyl-prolyl cis-trans isomerase